MKHNLLLVFVLVVGVFNGVYAQKTFVPDDNFEAYLEENGMGDDVLGNDSVWTVNISSVTYLVVNSLDISDLTGIEDFTALEALSCSNNSLTSLDVSANGSLDELYCYSNQLISLDVSDNLELEYLWCQNNDLISLDVSSNSALVNLYCENNQLTNLDVSSNVSLIGLWCYNNLLTSLDVSNNLTLILLKCYDNQLASLDVSSNVSLIDLWCYDNQLTSLDVSNGNNVNMDYINFTNNPDLYCIEVDDAAWSTNNWESYIDDWASYSNDCEGEIMGCIDTLAINYAANATLDDGSCIYEMTYVPDDNFEAYLEENGMGDGVLENDSVWTLSISSVTFLDVNSLGISDLTGIEDFTDLIYLNCMDNQLSVLDVSANVLLEELNCYSNSLTSLNVAFNTSLKNLWCGSNELSNLDLSSNILLTKLYCQGNALGSLDVSANFSLEVLRCHNNSLTSLDVSANIVLEDFWCQANQLTSLDVRNGNNVNMLDVFFAYNGNLYCIEVDNALWSSSNWGDYIDVWASFSEDCETVFGCMDKLACNYNIEATIDDGSCTYVDGICETCEDGVIVDNDADDDGICDDDEIETYNCVANSCVDPGDNTGEYASLEDCEEVCGLSWIDELSNGFFVYPNPANTVVNVGVEGEKVFYNALGEEVLRTKEQQIDISGFVKGIYLVRVGNTYAKFVKE